MRTRILTVTLVLLIIITSISGCAKQSKVTEEQVTSFVYDTMGLTYRPDAKEIFTKYEEILSPTLIERYNALFVEGGAWETDQSMLYDTAVEFKLQDQRVHMSSSQGVDTYMFEGVYSAVFSDMYRYLAVVKVSDGKIIEVKENYYETSKEHSLM